MFTSARAAPTASDTVPVLAAAFVGLEGNAAARLDSTLNGVVWSPSSRPGDENNPSLSTRRKIMRGGATRWPPSMFRGVAEYCGYCVSFFVGILFRKVPGSYPIVEKTLQSSQASLARGRDQVSMNSISSGAELQIHTRSAPPSLSSHMQDQCTVQAAVKRLRSQLSMPSAFPFS